MTQQTILDKLQPIFRDVLDNERIVITRSSSALNTENWDSLAHINLIEAIESEFGVKFALGELEDMKEAGDLIDLIERKQNVATR